MAVYKNVESLDCVAFKGNQDFTNGVEFILEKLYDLPEEENVVKVVRCKNCDYSNFIESCGKYECKKHLKLKNSDDFCSDGKEKIIK